MSDHEQPVNVNSIQEVKMEPVSPVNHCREAETSNHVSNLDAVIEVVDAVEEDDEQSANAATTNTNETESDNVEESNNIEIVPLWVGNAMIDERADIDVETVFQEKGCCARKCTQKFSVEELKRSRLQCAELDYYEQGTNKLNNMIIFKLQSLVNCDNTIKHARKTTSSERQRLKVNFMMHGRPVCRKLFLFSHGIKNARFERLLHVYKTEGVVEKSHGNCHRTPHNRTPFLSSQGVVRFLRNFAEQYAVFMPSRIANKYAIVKLLPFGSTKKSIYNHYTAACEANKSEPVSLLSFGRLWKNCCSDIAVLRPRSDLCAFCRKYFTSKVAFAGKSEEEKASFLGNVQSHMIQVEEEGAVYNKTIEESCQTLAAILNVPSSLSSVGLLPRKVHLSFDFAQQIHIPYSPQQVGPIFTLVPYGVGIFGIISDTTQQQCNFLIPEAVQLSKSDNRIISFLHHFVETYLDGIQELEIHADNLVAQNENNIIIAYLTWLIMSNRFSKITYNFIPVGHTKLSCDMAFSLFKNVLKYHDAHPLDDVINIFTKSTPESYIKFAIPCGTKQKDTCFKVFDWCKFFEHYEINKVPQITSFSHFVVSIEHPGSVRIGTNFSDDGVLYELIPAGINYREFQSLQNLQKISTESPSNPRQKNSADCAKNAITRQPLEYLITGAEAAGSTMHLEDIVLPKSLPTEKNRGRPRKNTTTGVPINSAKNSPGHSTKSANYFNFSFFLLSFFCLFL